MYSILAKELKSFTPTKDQWEEIRKNFNRHNYIHSGDNLFGEEYEVLVYEYLKIWANSCKDVSYFMTKDPANVARSRGLINDKNGQIIFIDGGKKLAEFDGIFRYKNKVVFVESSVSELRSYYRRLESKIEFKRKLLVDYYKTEEVYFLLVTRPKKKSMVYRSNPYLVLFNLQSIPT